MRFPFSLFCFPETNCNTFDILHTETEIVTLHSDSKSDLINKMESITTLDIDVDHNTSVDDADQAWDWGVPVTDLNLTNLSDVQYLSRILGPRRMGYKVNTNHSS